MEKNFPLASTGELGMSKLFALTVVILLLIGSSNGFAQWNDQCTEIRNEGSEHNELNELNEHSYLHYCGFSIYKSVIAECGTLNRAKERVILVCPQFHSVSLDNCVDQMSRTPLKECIKTMNTQITKNYLNGLKIYDPKSLYSSDGSASLIKTTGGTMILGTEGPTNSGGSPPMVIGVKNRGDSQPMVIGKPINGAE